MKTDNQSLAGVTYQCMDVRLKTNLLTYPQQYKALVYSINSDCYKFLYSPVGKVCGYIIWANLNRESVFRFERQSIGPTYPYEWIEGDILLVLDIVVEPQFRLDVLPELRRFIRCNKHKLFKRGNKFFAHLRVDEKKAG
ncbi:hypothetical protein EYS14_09290 [Alteromonadaceae bacterium M269]|nr:hypothetical protein EYS14_09290 [Alteromonadaceae bacterium M269]